jgi:cytochrome c
MKTKLICLATMVWVLGAPAQANTPEALAKKHACTACHATEEKLVGPAFKEIAKRHAPKPDAAASASAAAVTQMADTIKKGGTGKWGNVPMPAQAQLSDDEAKVLAKWILAMK